MVYNQTSFHILNNAVTDKNIHLDPNGHEYATSLIDLIKSHAGGVVHPSLQPQRQKKAEK